MSITETSKVIVFGQEFQAALKAAHAVAPNSDYDMVQLRVQASGGNLLVCARDPKNNMIVRITVGTTMVDIVHDRDEVIEISKASAHQIQGMKVKAGEDEEDPLLGLIIAGDRVSITDETGFDLGLRLTRVRRLMFDDGAWLGDVEAMLARAADSLPGECAHLSPAQWKKVAAVATATGVDLQVRPLHSSGAGMSRAMVLGDRVAGYVSHLPLQPDNPDDGGAETTLMDFDDNPEGPDDPDGGGQPAPTSAPAVRVLRAVPPKGIA